MRNIRNISGFYDALNNETFKKDPLWYQHIGTESSPGVYIDDGSMKVSGKMIADERKALAKVRDLLGIKKKTYQQAPQRDAVRLMVTFYQKFNLSIDKLQNFWIFQIVLYDMIIHHLSLGNKFTLLTF